MWPTSRAKCLPDPQQQQQQQYHYYNYYYNLQSGILKTVYMKSNGCFHTSCLPVEEINGTQNRDPPFPVSAETAEKRNFDFGKDKMSVIFLKPNT